MYDTAATAANLNATSGLAVDAAGNFFISTKGHRILKVTKSTGLITLLAGTGQGNFSGDGAFATSATLYNPCGIALDNFGNIYVADTYNNRIRKIIVSTGIITTVAGGGVGGSRVVLDNVAATSTTLSSPEDVAVDTFGNIYIADRLNRRVRKVTASTGIITTIAGNGNWDAEPTLPALGVAATISSFVSPSGVTVDTSGNIFYTDSYFSSVYKITASTGLLTLVAGGNNWHYGYNGDNIPATTALLRRPTYITLDTLGNIYFADRFNGRIRKITVSTGIITNVVGGGVGKNNTKNATSIYLTTGGIAVDAAGSIYFNDEYVVRKVTYSQVTPSSAVTSAPVSAPAATSITMSPRSAAPTPPPTLRPSASSGIITTIVGKKEISPEDDINRNVYGIAATAAVLSHTDGLAVDATGNLFISTIDHRILKVTASTGLITLLAGTGVWSFSGDGGLATSATFKYPGGIALDNFGNIYVADTYNDRIRKITVSTGIISTVAGGGVGYYRVVLDNVAATNTTLSYPGDVAVDTYGNIYIADRLNRRVRKVIASTGIITTIAGISLTSYADWATSPALGVAATLSKLDRPTGITVDTSGNVFITDSAFNSIYKVTASTGLLTLVAGKNSRNGGYNGDDILATTALLSNPSYITLDAEGNIFFSENGNLRIRKITASTGIITTVAGKFQLDFRYCRRKKTDGEGKDATLASICSPNGIAVDAAGSVYFNDLYVVRKITYSQVTPSSAVTSAPVSAPAATSITMTPTAGTSTPSASMPSAPASTPSGVSPTAGATTPSASMPSAPASTPRGVSPTAGTTTPSASMPSAPASTPSGVFPTAGATTPSASMPSAPASTPRGVSPTASTTTPSASMPSVPASTPQGVSPTAGTTTPSASMPSVPASTPQGVSPTAGSSASGPTISPSLSSSPLMSFAPVTSSTTASQSSSTTHAAGTGHLTITTILVMTLLTYNLHRDI